MVKIEEALQEIKDNSSLTDYAIAKRLGIQQIMVKRYLSGEFKSPSYKVCKAFYDEFGYIVFPYNEDELKGLTIEQ